MLRTLRARVWLTDRRHEPQPIRPAMSPAAMHERRAELQALMNTAPADHRELIERLTAGNVGSAEVHEHLVAATTAQQERRDWIVANWPHVVELEQVNALITAQPALAHWPTATPPAVQAVLDAMASSRVSPTARARTAPWRRSTRRPPPTTLFDRAEAKVRDLDELAAPRLDGRRTGCGRRGAGGGATRAPTGSPGATHRRRLRPIRQYCLTTTPSSDVGSPSATTS